MRPQALVVFLVIVTSLSTAIAITLVERSGWLNNVTSNSVTFALALCLVLAVVAYIIAGYYSQLLQSAQAVDAPHTLPDSNLEEQAVAILSAIPDTILLCNQDGLVLEYHSAKQSLVPSTISKKDISATCCQLQCNSVLKT